MSEQCTADDALNGNNQYLGYCGYSTIVVFVLCSFFHLVSPDVGVKLVYRRQARAVEIYE
jgi:hypothetical protein